MDDQIDWDHLFDDGFFDIDADIPSIFPTSSPDDGNLTNNTSPLSVDDIEQIDQLIVKDDDEYHTSDGFNSGQEMSDGFFQNILLDSPLNGQRSGEVVDVSDGNNSVKEHKNNDGVDQIENIDNSDGDPEDPVAKKRKRQLRNKDAALRSRERKKMYVKDLEMKSKYYEMECRRLGSVLQCLISENQALRFSLHSSKAHEASMTKQESAVLLLESLLLGSLLWLLGVVCHLILPRKAVQPVIVVKEKLPSPPVLRSNLDGHLLIRALLVGKRCKASRSRMKSNLHSLAVF